MPPCWYRQADGSWAAFYLVHGKCPWDGAVRVSGQSAIGLDARTRSATGGARHPAGRTAGRREEAQVPMRSRPSEGRAFPCWRLLGRSSQASGFVP